MECGARKQPGHGWRCSWWSCCNASSALIVCGYLQRGPLSSPAGGGHWLIVVGITPTHLIMHDPLGEADLGR